MPGEQINRTPPPFPAASGQCCARPATSKVLPLARHSIRSTGSGHVSATSTKKYNEKRMFAARYRRGRIRDPAHVTPISCTRNVNCDVMTQIECGLSEADYVANVTIVLRASAPGILGIEPAAHHCRAFSESRFPGMIVNEYLVCVNSPCDQVGLEPLSNHATPSLARYQPERGRRGRMKKLRTRDDSISAPIIDSAASDSVFSGRSIKPRREEAVVEEVGRGRVRATPSKRRERQAAKTVQ